MTVHPGQWVAAVSTGLVTTGAPTAAQSYQQAQEVYARQTKDTFLFLNPLTGEMEWREAGADPNPHTSLSNKPKLKLLLK